MSIKVKIGNIASISSGVYFKDIPDGDVNYLQVRDFNEDKEAVYSTVELNIKTRKHLLSEGDLLFAAKGMYNFCTIFRESIGLSIASSSFLVLKVKDKRMVNPEYLCWFLNRSDVISTLKSSAVGSSIPSIGKSVIEECQVDIPTIAIQQKIIEIAKLQQKEQLLYKKISNRRDILLQKQIIEMIQNK